MTISFDLGMKINLDMLLAGLNCTNYSDMYKTSMFFYTRAF